MEAEDFNMDDFLKEGGFDEELKNQAKKEAGGAEGSGAMLNED